MGNPRKADGTHWETDLVALAKAYGCQAYRLAEGGTKDAGDVVIVTPQGDHYVIEAKNRAQLNAHGSLVKAIKKAARADLPFHVAGVGLAWKRLERREGAKRRVQVGVPVMVVTVEEWLQTVTKG